MRDISSTPGFVTCATYISFHYLLLYKMFISNFEVQRLPALTKVFDTILLVSVF